MTDLEKAAWAHYCEHSASERNSCLRQAGRRYGHDSWHSLPDALKDEFCAAVCQPAADQLL